ncbi:MAG TPA: stage III sporulation protein AA [Clostridiaceae bacterium]|jgi:stage III sporulation protein AA|nr:stage III sporulation protein AA [Clostridiaceae bacterium]
MEYILKCLPTQLAKLILEHNIQKLEEIRIRVNKPVILKLGQVEIVLNYTITTNEIIGILQNICNNSIYTYQNQICNGFITLPGGNRVGIAGNVVIKDGQVSNISYIYSLNFRISHQINGASDNILKYVLDTENNTIFNTLIVSPPGAGKTTMIRDLAKRISNGINEINFRGLDVSIIDERGEIAAMTKGITFNDVGIRTDVLDNVPKSIGIRMAVRSMAPKVIIADEIGNKDDVNIINYAICSGVKCIFTAHGSNMEDLLKNNEINKIINLQLFSKIIFLDEKQKGKIKNVVNIQN